MRRMRRVGLKPQTTKPQGKPMLKRIALTALFVATAAIAGVGVAKAHGGVKKAGSVQVDTTPRGFCIPAGKC
jgi:hypothetical protein